MTDLGDVGKSIGTAKTHAAKSVYGDNNRVAGNVATGSGATASAMIVLVLNRGQIVDETRADGSGGWSFYDMDDGVYSAKEVGSANAWSVVIAGASVTVTRLSPGTISHGHVS